MARAKASKRSESQRDTALLGAAGKHLVFSRLLLFVLSLLLTSLQVPPASAAIADCVRLGFPTVSSGSTSITISTTMSVTCTNQQLGTGGGPLYTVVEESFGTYCSGPYSLAGGMTSTIRCSIPIGGTSGSLRTGATTSTLKIWFAYDYSTKFLTVNHTSIPARSTNSGGSSMGGSSTGTTTVTPIYTKDAIVERTSTKSIIVGSKTNSLYNFVSSQNAMSLSMSSQTPTICPIQSGYIVGESVGLCRLLVSSSTKGMVLGYSNYPLDLQVVKKTDAISVSFATSSSVGNDVYFNAKSDSGVSVISQVSTPLVCSIEGTTLRMLATGDCRVELSTRESDSALPATKSLTISVRKGSQSITFPDRSFILNMSDKRFTLSASSSAGLDVTAVSLSPKVCTATALEISAKKPGTCRLLLSQNGSANYYSAPALEITGFVAEDRISINCVKGSKVKKILAVDPRCPKGYRER